MLGKNIMYETWQMLNLLIYSTRIVHIKAYNVKPSISNQEFCSRWKNIVENI